MRYQVGGSLGGDDPNYVVRQADEQLYAWLKAGNFCYVLNSPQMGKSSLLQRTKHRLEKEGYACVYLDMTRLGSESTTPVQWYKSIIVSLFYEFNLGERVNLKKWWEQQAEFTPMQRLQQFVEQVLLKEVKSDRIFIFIDEIDTLLSLKFPVNDFFVWIRDCYNHRTDNPDFNRLGFALFGVVSPSDLINDQRQAPFNIGQAIKLYGFQLHEATPLLKGLEQIITQPRAVLQEIIHWTGGQPFLTQKLCQLVVRVALESSTEMITIPPGTEGFWVEQLVKSRIILHWETQDEPEHLRTIRNRLLFHEHRAGHLLGLYQQILQAQANQTSGVASDDSREHTELLLSGLVEKHNGYLKIKNPIYESIFNAEWVIRQLDNLRPYSQTFNAWVASGYEDESRLLRGKALKDTQNWAQGKSLSNLDYQFLAASQECEQRQVQIALQAIRVKEIETQLVQEKQTTKLQKILLVVGGIGLLVSMAFGVGTLILYHQAKKNASQAKSSEIKALVSSSQGLFASNRRLDALIEAIKAKHKLEKLGTPNSNIQHQVENVLEQAVYAADEYNRFSGHTAAILAVDVSPDSSLIASASIDQTIKLWRRDGTEVATLKGHKKAVRTVDFSPDGLILASAGEDGTIKLWRRDGTLLNTFKCHTVSVWGVAFSPDGEFLASASWDGTVKIWKRDGTLLKTFASYSKRFWGVAFSPDGQIVAAANSKGTVKLWKKDTSGWQNAKPLQTLKGHSDQVMGVVFSPDGQMIASSSEDTTVKLWQRDGIGKYRFDKTLKGHTSGISKVAFSPDGQTIASASLDKTIKLWNIDGTEQRTLKGHNASVWGVTFSKDSSFIASAGAENVVRLWQSQNPFQKSIVAHKAGILSIAITEQSSTIATASHENTVKLWNRQGKLLKTLTSGGVVFDVSFSEDGQLIAFASSNDTVKLKQRDGTDIAAYKNPNGKITKAILSPDGQAIAIVNDKIAQIWKRNQPAPQILTGHAGEVWQVAFSRDNRLVASASGDGTVKLWTLEGKLLKTLVGHSAAVWQVAFSQDSKILASGSGDNTVKLWTLDGKLLKTLKGHTGAIWGVAFSPDGKTVASGSVDNTIKLWQLDGTELTTLKGHTAAIRKIAISHDGSLLVSGGDDNTLIIWNLPRILNLDALAYGCTLVQDYLKNNTALEKSERAICTEKGMGHGAWRIGQ